MPQDLIGTKDGMNFYVGSNTAVQPTVPDRSLGSVGTPQLPFAQTNMVGTGTTNFAGMSNPVSTGRSLTSSTPGSDGSANFGSDSAMDRLLTQLSSGLGPDEKSYEDTIMGNYQKRQDAISTASAARAKQIENQSNEDIYYQQQANQNQLTGEQESRRGFATNTALFQQIQDTGQKRIRDLEKQRDQYLLQNDQNQADQLNSLLATEQQTITTARQNYYSNMFSLLSAGNQQQQFELGKTPTQRLNALAQIRQSLFFSGASADELAMIDKLISDTATGGGVTNAGGGIGTGIDSQSLMSPVQGLHMAPDGKTVLDAQGNYVSLQQYKQMTGQTDVPDNKVDWSYAHNKTASGTNRSLTSPAITSQSVNNVSGYGYNGTPGSYKQYNSPAESFTDTVNDIQKKMEGNTKTGLNADSSVKDLVNVWVTGSKTGTPTGYTAQNVADYLKNTIGIKGVTANTPLYQIGAENLASAIAHFETGYNHTTGQFANGATGSGSTQTQQSQSTLQSLADSYYQQLSKGVPPSQISGTFAGGQYGSMQGIALSNAMTKYYTENPNQNIGKTEINYAALKSASADVADQAANRLVTIKKLQLAMSNLQSLSDKFARSGVTAINDKWLKSQLAINNPDAIKFNQAVTNIADDIGQVFASGGALTDFKLQFGNGLIDKNYSPSGMKAALAEMSSLMNLQAQAYNDVLSNPSGLGTGRDLTGGVSSSNRNLNSTSQSILDKYGVK